MVDSYPAVPGASRSTTVGVAATVGVVAAGAAAFCCFSPLSLMTFRTSAAIALTTSGRICGSADPGASAAGAAVS